MICRRFLSDMVASFDDRARQELAKYLTSTNAYVPAGWTKLHGEKLVAGPAQLTLAEYEAYLSLAVAIVFQNFAVEGSPWKNRWIAVTLLGKHLWNHGN